jgi:hypothetical protein
VIIGGSKGSLLMNTYIMLAHFTEQGIPGDKQTP